MLSLEERIAVGDIVEGSGVLRHLRGVGDLQLRDHAALMTIVSDNTATNAVIDRLGIDRVNDRMAEWGCRGSLLGARLFDREVVARGARNVMTARETASLLQRLVRAELIDRATSDAVLGVLAHATDGGRIRRYLPYDASVAHKPGTLRGVRNDVGVARVDRPVIAVGSSATSRTRPPGTSFLACSAGPHTGSQAGVSRTDHRPRRSARDRPRGLDAGHRVAADDRYFVCSCLPSRSTTSLVFTTTMAFALSRPELPGRRIILVLVLFTKDALTCITAR